MNFLRPSGGGHFIEAAKEDLSTVKEHWIKNIGRARQKADHNYEGDYRKVVDFVRAVGVERLVTWQMLYCGGSQPVVDALESVEREYGVKLRVEKFDW